MAETSRLKFTTPSANYRIFDRATHSDAR